MPQLASEGAIPQEEVRFDATAAGLNELSRARAVIWVNLACVLVWIVINVVAGWELHNARPYGVALAGAGMAIAWSLALREISAGRMARGVALYTVSGLVLLLAMGISVPELSLLFTFATFIFLAFGLSYMSGRASKQVVALTLVVALILLVTSVGFGWTSGVPNNVFRWINLVGMLMALSIDATMFVMLRRTLEGRANRLLEAERAAGAMLQRTSQQERLESLGKLAGGVAHDFNNLLAVILNYSSFVAEAVEDRPAALADVGQIQSAARRAAGLTRQLLIFGRRLVDIGELVDINRVVTDTEGLLRTAIGEHIELRTSLNTTTSTVRVDTSRIEQVLLNLSLNARDAMPGGGVLLISTADHDVSGSSPDAATPQPGRYVCLVVSDTGTGLTDEARRHAFEPFFTTKPVGSGTGLGLATVHGIARDAGGGAALYSKAGQGTTVRVYIPASGGPAIRSAPAGDPKRLLQGAGRTILLVEDEPQLREITARTLERHGFRPIPVESPDEALTLLETDAQIALLLTDVVMPGMSGLQLAEAAMTLRPALRILFMSGFPRDLWERGDIDPDLALIEKPFAAEALLQKLSDVLDSEPHAVALTPVVA
jgi:signal transduction histidine kinase